MLPRSAVTPSTSRVTNMTTPLPRSPVVASTTTMTRIMMVSTRTCRPPQPEGPQLVRPWARAGSNQPLPDVPVETCPDAARPTEYTAYVVTISCTSPRRREGLLWTIMRANAPCSVHRFTLYSRALTLYRSSTSFVLSSSRRSFKARTVRPTTC